MGNQRKKKNKKRLKLWDQQDFTKFKTRSGSGVHEDKRKKEKYKKSTRDFLEESF